MTIVCASFRQLSYGILSGGGGLAHDQDGTGSMFDDFFSVTAEQEMLPSGITVSRYHQEIGRQLGSNSNDFIARMKCAALCRADLLVLKLCPS